MRRSRVLGVAVFFVMALSVIAPGAAGASSNVGPSSAVSVQLGSPFTGVWKDTPFAHGNEDRRYHWWRLTSTLRTGDSVRLAVDNTDAEDTSTTSGGIAFCLLRPVDEYQADAAMDEPTCFRGEVGPDRFVEGRRLGRITLKYNDEGAGQPFIVVGSVCCDVYQSGSYTVTAESIAQRVNIGAIPPRLIRRRFTYRASLTYGDNSPTASGLHGVLQWRRAKGYPGPKQFRDLASTTSNGGALTFNARRPKGARGRIQLRACVSQPGGRPRCTKAATVKVGRG